MSADNKGGRIVFLDHLRGLACLIVVFGHVYLMGVNDFATTSVWLPFVQSPVFGPDSPGLNPFNGFSTWLVLTPKISLGALGVAIFFLISGYVILFTVDRQSPGKFLVLRAFRIFPLAAFMSIGMATGTAILCWRYGGVSPHTIGSVIATTFAAPGLFGTFSTIPVIWSLTVEVIFYVVMALASLAFGRIELRHIAIVSAGCAVLSTLSQLPEARQSFPPAYGGALVTLGYCAFHASFLLLGSALYRCHNSAVPLLRSFAWIALVGGIYAASLALSIGYGSVGGTGTTWQTGVAAFVIFVVAMLAGVEWRALHFLRFFGNISYSLYLFHIPAAWAIMFMLGARGYGMHEGVLTALVICVLFSWLTHRLVEIPSQNFGRALFRHGSERKSMPTFSTAGAVGHYPLRQGGGSRDPYRGIL